VCLGAGYRRRFFCRGRGFLGLLDHIQIQCGRNFCAICGWNDVTFYYSSPR
jgi:hypothetical protein